MDHLILDIKAIRKRQLYEASLADPHKHAFSTHPGVPNFCWHCGCSRSQHKGPGCVERLLRWLLGG